MKRIRDKTTIIFKSILIIVVIVSLITYAISLYMIRHHLRTPINFMPSDLQKIAWINAISLMVCIPCLLSLGLMVMDERRKRHDQ